MSARPPARFITLEGGEGAGKSTQARRLQAALAGRGISALLTREPGGAPGAEQIRTLLLAGERDRWDPVSETLLHSAARREHLVRTVWPALAAGDWVICDRFVNSTLAYQGYGLGLDLEVIRAVTRATVGTFAPDLTLVIDLPAAEGLARAASRHEGATRYEQMELAFHDRVRQGFLTLAAAEPGRCVVIDGRDPVETVAAAIEQAMAAKLLTPTN